MDPGLQVTVDLDRVAKNAAEVKARTGRFVYATVKADAYGLGASSVAWKLVGVVDGFYVFDLAEAIAAGLGDLNRNVIALDQPWRGYTAQNYETAGVRPVVHSVARARALRDARPVLAVDTGMRRFGCELDQANQAILEGGIDEVMTHAVRVEGARMLAKAFEGRGLRLHAAGSALLDEPDAWLDAVRPGLTLYRGAMHVEARVVEAHDIGPGQTAGYTGFEAQRVGVILAGYSHGLRAGSCLVRGQRRKLIEVGMQSSYVELLPAEGVGERIVLLGEGLTEAEVGAAWNVSEQDVLVRLGRNRAPEVSGVT